MPTARTSDQRKQFLKKKLIPMSSRELSTIATHGYVQLAAIVLFYYDYLLTFAAEVSHVWPQPISPLFFFSLNSVIQWSCKRIVRAREALLVLGQVAVSATLATRTIALYHKSRTVIIGVVGFGFVLAGVTCWTLVAGQRSTSMRPSAPGCHYVLTERSAIHLAAAWEASTLFDVLVFSLTLMRTLNMRKMHNMAIRFTGEGLLDMILRDGALYFAVMALASLANIFSFYFAASAFKGTFSTPASCISSSLCSRLVLNLYEVATPDSTDSGSSPEPMTTVILTTRIELGTTMDDDLSEVESVESMPLPTKRDRPLDAEI